MPWPDATRVVLVLTALGLVGWDVVVFHLAGPDATISRVCLAWAERFPLLPLAFGVLLGHLLSAQAR